MFTMSSFLGVTQFSFRSHRRSSAKSKRREPSSSNNSSDTNIPITSTAATFPADTLLDDLENLVQCNTPLAFDNDIYTEQQSQELQQNPDLHDVSAAPVPEIVPIFHPNEVLLQRFPNKTSFKRPSEIRLHKAHNPSANSTNSNDAGKAPRRNRAGTQPQPYTSSQPQLTTTRRFRSSSLIEHLTRISSRNSANNDYSSSNDLSNDETTTTSLTNITNNAPLSSLSGSHTQANTSNGSPTATTRTTTATPAVMSEVSQQYLTRNCVPGTLYVTTAASSLCSGTARPRLRRALCSLTFWLVPLTLWKLYKVTLASGISFATKVLTSAPFHSRPMHMRAHSSSSLPTSGLSRWSVVRYHPNTHCLQVESAILWVRRGCRQPWRL